MTFSTIALLAAAVAVAAADFCPPQLSAADAHLPTAMWALTENGNVTQINRDGSVRVIEAGPAWDSVVPSGWGHQLVSVAFSHELTSYFSVHAVTTSNTEGEVYFLWTNVNAPGSQAPQILFNTTTALNSFAIVHYGSVWSDKLQTWASTAPNGTLARWATETTKVEHSTLRLARIGDCEPRPTEVAWLDADGITMWVATLCIRGGSHEGHLFGIDVGTGAVTPPVAITRQNSGMESAVATKSTVYGIESGTIDFNKLMMFPAPKAGQAGQIVPKEVGPLCPDRFPFGFDSTLAVVEDTTSGGTDRVFHLAHAVDSTDSSKRANVVEVYSGGQRLGSVVLQLDGQPADLGPLTGLQVIAL